MPIIFCVTVVVLGAKCARNPLYCTVVQELGNPLQHLPPFSIVMFEVGNVPVHLPSTPSNIEPIMLRKATSTSSHLLVRSHKQE